ncbi:MULTISPECIES: hypothetical protein [unclassified Meiothermus]|uniref:hypothetical protein n=1 Tax=unclassified Meiothermus TaxID=370471 RepID=UPI000D7B9BD2|nr:MULTISPECIES: hypothetical protein [unclassified Meiothermus]PZA07644.1 hypothetical protein DNA98_04825 [Meiothermus sp. Pnk-1]RYM36481.1 hypothetical protein EWH23_09725 [Meiothermus sp. PNK-Is4]
MRIQSVSLVGALLVGLAWGQKAALEPQALDLLNQARAALGGQSLTNLKTYRERTKLTLLAADGKVQGELIQLTLYDVVPEVAVTDDLAALIAGHDLPLERALERLGHP